jgi:hypothetical protein
MEQQCRKAVSALMLMDIAAQGELEVIARLYWTPFLAQPDNLALVRSGWGPSAMSSHSSNQIKTPRLQVHGARAADHGGRKPGVRT